MEFIIRELQKDDSNKRFVELQREYWAHMDKFEKGYSEGLYLESVNDSNKDNSCYIATLNGKMIAFATFYYEKEYFDNKETIIVKDVFVLEEYRFHGIGSLLVEHIKEYSKKMKIDFLYACVLHGDLQAIKFFKNLGFKKDSRQSFVMNVWLIEMSLGKQTSGISI